MILYLRIYFGDILVLQNFYFSKLSVLNQFVSIQLLQYDIVLTKCVPFLIDLCKNFLKKVELLLIFLWLFYGLSWWKTLIGYRSRLSYFEATVVAFCFKYFCIFACICVLVHYAKIVICKSGRKWHSL